MRKPRIYFSLLAQQPLHIKAQLLAWLTTGGPNGIGLSYVAAQKKLLEDFGIKVSSTAVQKFYHRHNRPTIEAGEKTVDIAVPQGVQSLVITINVRTQNSTTP